jgi:uncharacterized RDD family membrane protein YckC
VDLILRRAAAYLLDIALLFVLLMPLGFLATRTLGLEPTTGFEVWLAAVLSFSVPVWAYFTLSDSSRGGATLGKRLLGVRVTPRIPRLRALGRNVLKLLPWEIAHVFGFALADVLGETVQAYGLGLANLLAIVWFGVALGTRGRKSVHDFAVDTEVARR